MGLAKLETRPVTSALRADVTQNWSIEVMPRTAAKVENFRALLPAGTRVYIAHIAGTPIDDMVATARRLGEDGFAVMPHFPAREIADRAMLEDWISRYRDEAGVTQALLLGGGHASPVGAFDSAIQLMERASLTGTALPACMWPATPRAMPISMRGAARPMSMRLS